MCNTEETWFHIFVICFKISVTLALGMLKRCIMFSSLKWRKGWLTEVSKKWNKIRKKCLQSNQSNSSSNYSKSKKRDHTSNGNEWQKPPNSIPCKECQMGKCTIKDYHKRGSFTCRHICRFCLYDMYTFVSNHQE